MSRTVASLAGLAAAVSLLASCGKGSSKGLPDQAVGTYVGGGSMIVGPDSCTYEGSPSVFQTSGAGSTTPERGPRFVFAAGTIKVKCEKTSYEVKAVEPTGATISGPTKVKVGASSESFAGHLVAGDRELSGEGSLAWTLGKDCDGLAEFGPVLGSQDTGGPDRTRTLVAKAKGACTIVLAISTGTSLEPSFAPKTFQAERRVTIE